MPIKRGLTFFFLLGCLTLSFPLLALSEDGDSSDQASGDKMLRPDMVKLTTPAYLPDFKEFDPPLGEYNFSVRWQGIPAAYLTFKVDRDGDNFRLVAEAKTASAIDLFYALRYRGESLISGIDFSPIRTLIDYRENSRIKNVDLTFSPSGMIKSVYTKKGAPTQILEFDPQNFTLDPFAAGFVARSQDWAVGETRQFDTFDGRSRYLISLTCTGSETIEVGGVDREAWVIEPKVENMTNPKNNKKLRSAQIYLAKDKTRDVLKLVSKVFIGSVSTRLESFTPYDHHKPPTALAAGTKDQPSL